MKKIFYCALLFIGAVAVLYYAPVQQDSVLYGLKSAVVETVSSTQVAQADAADLEQKLSFKKEELRAYEDALVKIDEADEQIRANAPICPTTGEKAITTMTRDPRPELRDKIEKLEYEIADLESRI